MPNYCDFELRVRCSEKHGLGSERERLQKFLDWLNADYSYHCEGGPKITIERATGTVEETEHHIGYRIFETDTKDLSAFDEKETGLCVYLTGYCAWSVFSCMFEGDFSYYSDSHEENLKNYGRDPSITLPDAARELGLEIEIFSSEPGMCFAEHYIVNAEGEVLVNDETEFIDLCIDDFETYKDLKKSYEDKDCTCPVLKSEFDKGKKEGDTFISICKWLTSNGWPWRFA